MEYRWGHFTKYKKWFLKILKIKLINALDISVTL